MLTIVLAQKNNEVSGDKETIAYDQGKALYDKANYTEAITYFEQALDINPKNANALYWCGLSCRYSSQHEKAVQYFKKLDELNPSYWPWFYYEMGVAYAELKQYDQAIEAYNQFLKKYTKDPGNALYHHQANYKLLYAQGQKALADAPVMMKSPVKLSDDVNSKYDDYMPALNPTGTKLYFTSKRLGGISREESSSKEGDEDIYFIEKAGGTWSSPKLLPEPINSSSNEGAACFSADGQVMVYTACGRDKGIGSCDIFIATLEGDTWTTPINMGAL